MAKATPDSAMARNRPWSIETHGIDAIGGEERRGKPSDTFWVWFAANISVLGVTYGGYLVIFYGLDLWQTVVAAVVGVVASFLLVGLISLAGKRAGAPTMVLSRAPFGVIGNGLPALVSYVTLVGFEIVLASLAALAIRTVLTRLGAASSTGELAVGFVMVVALAVAVSLFGQATIQRVLTWFTAAFGALTLVFMALEARQVDWRKVAALPHGNLLAGLLGGLSIIMAGTGLTWTNTAADYSRYLPRSVSSRGVVWWTTFGASLPLVALIVFGGLLAANDASVATSSDPIGVLAAPLPTWFLIPYMITAVGGLVAEVVMSSYSGGLNLLTLGLRTARHKSILLDSVLVASGSIYILFFSPSFFAPFEGFLVTMGAALASWAAIFLVDLWVFRRGGICGGRLVRLVRVLWLGESCGGLLSGAGHGAGVGPAHLDQSRLRLDRVSPRDGRRSKGAGRRQQHRPALRIRCSGTALCAAEPAAYLGLADGGERGVNPARFGAGIAMLTGVNSNACRNASLAGGMHGWKA